MKRLKKTYLVNEGDLETLEYNEPQEDLFRGESILAAANKVFYFEKFKKEQALREMKNEKVDVELFLNESVLVAANKFSIITSLKNSNKMQFKISMINCWTMQKQQIMQMILA